MGSFLRFCLSFCTSFVKIAVFVRKRSGILFMSDHQVDKSKRGFLVAASSVVGGVAAGAAAVPFVASMMPSERAKAAGAPVEVDIAKLGPGEKMTVEWRGQPVWVMRRTKEMLDAVAKSADLVSDPKSERKKDELTPA